MVVEGVFNTPRYAVNVSPTYTVSESGKQRADCKSEGVDSIINCGAAECAAAVFIVDTNDGDSDDDDVLAMCNSGFCKRMTRKVGTADTIIVSWSGCDGGGGGSGSW